MVSTDVLVSGIFGGAMGSLVGVFAGLLIFFFVIAILIYLYQAYCQMKISDKSKTPNSWLAFIPIANFYLLTQMAGVSGLWTLGLAAAFIPMIGGLAVLVLTVWLWWQAIERIKRPAWLALLIWIPVINWIIYGMLAFGSEDKK